MSSITRNVALHPFLSAGRERLAQSSSSSCCCFCYSHGKAHFLFFYSSFSLQPSQSLSHTDVSSVFLCCPGRSSFHLSVSPSSSVMPWARSSSRTLSRCPGSGKPWPVKLEPNSVLWWTLKREKYAFCFSYNKSDVRMSQITGLVSLGLVVKCYWECTSFQMTVSDSPVVLEVPTEKINLRSHATRSSLSTWGRLP